MVTFRQIREDEIPQARDIYAKKYPWAQEPDWKGVWVRLEDGQIRGMVSYHVRTLVGLLDADSPALAAEMIARADAQLAGMGINQYEVLVPKANERMWQALERHYGLTPEEMEYKDYIVKRD